MSYDKFILLPSKAQCRAWKALGWEEVEQRLSHFDKRFANKTSQHLSKLRNIQFSEQATSTLAAMNEFDRMMVLKDCKTLITNPYHPKSSKNKLLPSLRWMKSLYRFGPYHYKIRYFTTANHQVIIDELVIDEEQLGVQANKSNERTAMYLVRRGDSNKKISASIHFNDLRGLEEGWDVDEITPVSQIDTPFAAINGMQNDLKKAAWLMGVHLDWAYQNNPAFNQFTLLHNPTEGVLDDLWECGWDKAISSLNANHLSAIMVDAQRKNKAVNWLAHSQGGIILLRALKIIEHRTFVHLNAQQIALHSVGSNVMQTKAYASKVKLKIHSVNANPFDIVSNKAGGNAPGRESWARSVGFLPSVMFSDPGISPHTLPFMGIKTYLRHLTEAGKLRRARIVQNYMTSNNL